MQQQAQDREAIGRFIDGREGSIERVSWDEHFAFLIDSWGAGQHCSIFASTDGGKSHLIRKLLPLWWRYPVLIFQVKPKDATLRGVGNRVQQYPSLSQRVRYRMRPASSKAWETDPEWFTLTLPQYRWKEKRTYERARAIAADGMERAYREGEWVVVFDEVRRLAGREEPYLNIGAPMTNLWELGRSQPLTVIAGTQAPAGAPSPMYDQARHLYLGRIQDVYRNERLAEIGGDTKLLREVLPTLEGREFLYVFMGRARGEVDRMWIVEAPA